MCKVQEFDQFFSKEYSYLTSFAKSIDPKSDYESLLHDSYIRCKDRITVAGFTGRTFLNFTRVAIINGFKSNYRLQKKRVKVCLEDENYYHFIENHLQLKLDQEEQEQEYQAQISYINTMIYQYLDEKYDDKDRFIFKTYFLLKPKKINYKQLSEATGFSITGVSNTIKRMKADIKMNLQEYINGREINTGCTIFIGH